MDRGRQYCYKRRMKTQNNPPLPIFVKSCIALAGSLFFMAIMGGAIPAADVPLPLDPAGSSAQQDMRKAEKEFEQAAGQFSGGNSQNGKSGQRTGQTSWSDVNSSTTTSSGQSNNAASQKPDARAQALQGSPETGYAGTWTDPATGDIITSVIAPTPPQNQSQNYPIIIEPQVSGGDWGYNNGNNYNSGWQNGWPQWPGYVGEPGYGTVPPPPPPGFRPPGYFPPPPAPSFPPNGIGPNIWHPNFPIPPHPGYRPLRPYPPKPGIWQPGMKPPAWQPGMKPPSWQPGMNPLPNPGFNPHPPSPGFMPGNPPGWKPLPMRPGGMGWGNQGPGPRPPRGGF